ncbi:MAG TPA: RNA 2',3'-cyclic phosphodiesterase [Pseudomonadota bacterium]|nr:RNA 2',3'-cyclic phosphodiesterase [Pseudomonadota bacterium]
MSPSVRCFWAVRPPEPNLIQVGQLARALKRPVADCGLKVGWVAPAAYHLTLKFLGEVAEGRLGEMTARVAAQVTEVARSAAPQLTLAGLGVFPGVHRPQVVFLGVSPPAAELMELQARLESCLAELGYPRDPRPFHPHLTLGRVRAASAPGAGAQPALPELLQRHPEAQGPAFPVTELILYESRPTPQGPSYTPLMRLPLLIKPEPPASQGPTPAA